MEMTFAEWKEKFKPIEYPAQHAPYNEIPEEYLWTEHDNGEMRWIRNGWHICNRVATWVTEIPYPDTESEAYIPILPYEE